MIQETTPDIIAITEVKPTNFSRTLTALEYQLPGYNMEMDGLDSEDRGRGTAIYIHQSLQYIRIDLARVIQSQTGTVSVPIDFIACEIKLTEDKLLLCNIYRSPNNSKVNDQLLNDTMRKLSDTGHYKQILMVGDFNHPGISWEDVIANGEDDYNFLETVRDCFLTQHVSTPTRGRGAQIPSVLDLVLTSVDDAIEFIDVGGPSGLKWPCYNCVWI